MDQPPHVPEYADRPPPVPDAPAPVAPPIRPTGEIGGARSSWPNVLGTLICIFAGLGILYRLMGLIGIAIMSMVPLPPEAQMPSNVLWWTVVLSVVGLPVSCLHLLAGIQTLRRRPGARLWVVLFFLYVLALVVPNAILQHMSMQHQMQVTSQQGGAPPGLTQFMQALGPVLIVVTALWSMAWPTFLLIWYSRRRIREEMAGWAARGAV